MLTISRATLWRLRRSGDFPAAIRLSANRRGYVLDEIAAWIERRRAERRP
jgi:predicted DNA-binding transcriptional regulator AlpA